MKKESTKSGKASKSIAEIINHGGDCKKYDVQIILKLIAEDVRARVSSFDVATQLIALVVDVRLLVRVV